MKTCAIIGFGSRGQMFAGLLRNESEMKLVAIAEPVLALRKQARDGFGIPEKNCYASAEEFFAQPKLCDALFICTQDAQHKEHAMKAMRLGYDICLEKPAAATIEDCIAIRDTANELHRKVMLTHVLRYSPFYGEIKRLIGEGKIGEVVTVNQTENIAYWHFALSYVRGPWRNMEDSTPTIIAKCCHDLDILIWLMGKKCKYVSSFGKLYYFEPTHAPEGSAPHCADCRKDVREKCLYNAYNIYPQRMNTSVVGGTARLKGRDIYEILDEKKDSITECVFWGKHDAVDNQVVNMMFENGATAHLTMTAFSERCYRYIHVHGTQGEIYGDMDEGILHVVEFGKKEYTVDANKIAAQKLNDGHGGGDYFLLKDFINYLNTDTPSVTRTTIDDSIESHIVGFKAEESRLKNGEVMDVKG